MAKQILVDNELSILLRPDVYEQMVELCLAQVRIGVPDQITQDLYNKLLSGAVEGLQNRYRIVLEGALALANKPIP